jgi:hypothetical protein
MTALRDIEGTTAAAPLTPRQQKLLEVTCGGGLTRARVDDLVEVAGTWESLVRRGFLRCIRSDAATRLVITERGLLALVAALVDERERREADASTTRLRGGDAVRAVRDAVRAVKRNEDVVEDIEDRTPEEIHAVLDDLGAAAPTEAYVEAPVKVLSPQPPCSECGSVIGLKRYDGRCAPCADRHDRRRS